MLNYDEIIYSNPNSAPADPANNLIPFINYQVPSPTRCLDMLLDKYYGRDYQTEVMMISPEKPALPRLKTELKDASIMLITDGGIVPKGNPDRIPSTSSDRFGVYPILNTASLCPDNYEISHQGYDNTFVEDDPNRLLPVDALRELEQTGMIGKLHDCFISTTGVMTSTEQSKSLGKEIAQYVAAQPVDGVIITSACGTSTRCGSYIGMAIEEKGIPVVQVTNLTKIAADTGIARVIRGSNVCYPFGSPSLSEKSEYQYRLKLAAEAVNLFTLIPADF